MNSHRFSTPTRRQPLAFTACSMRSSCHSCPFFEGTLKGDVSHGELLSGRGRTRTCSLARSNSPYTSFFQSRTLSTSTCCLPHSRGRQRPGKDGGKGQEEGGQGSRTSNVVRCRCRQPRAPRAQQDFNSRGGSWVAALPGEQRGAVCGRPPAARGRARTTCTPHLRSPRLPARTGAALPPPARPRSFAYSRRSINNRAGTNKSWRRTGT